MLISLTVGKVDAGVAVLLTADKRLIEFPSILLPSSITSGSIVDITVSQNPTLEQSNALAFRNLQSSILSTYGLNSPQPPVLRLRNATQTSIVLEWDPLDLATATFRSLALYRNNAKAGLIPRFSSSSSAAASRSTTQIPTTLDGAHKPPSEPVLATKVSGLAIDSPYTFHLILRTSAGTYTSNKLSVRTQKMTDLTGITVTPGPLPPPLRPALAAAVERIGAKLVEGVRIDTTHFVCTEGRGREWERAVEMNVPVVRPEWVEGCEREGRIVGVRAYYLGADPKLRQVGQGVGVGGRGGVQSPATPGQTPQLGQQESQVSLPARERVAAGPEESQTSLAASDGAAGGSGGGGDLAVPSGGGDRPVTPVTPWPPSMNQRPPGDEDDDDVSSEEEGGRSPPVVPTKDDQPTRAAGREEEEEDEDEVSEAESEDGDIGKAGDRGDESSDKEDTKGKPGMVREESQGDLSDVQL